MLGDTYQDMKGDTAHEKGLDREADMLLDKKSGVLGEEGGGS